MFLGTLIAKGLSSPSSAPRTATSDHQWSCQCICVCISRTYSTHMHWYMLYVCTYTYARRYAQDITQFVCHMHGTYVICTCMYLYVWRCICMYHRIIAAVSSAYVPVCLEYLSDIHANTYTYIHIHYCICGYVPVSCLYHVVFVCMIIYVHVYACMWMYVYVCVFWYLDSKKDCTLKCCTLSA